MTLKIIIVGRETVVTRLIKDAGMFLLFGSLIGLGIVADSSAMQWAGFLIATLVVVTKTKAKVEQRSFTIDEARKELDQMEREIDAETGKEMGSVPDVQLPPLKK